MQRFPATHRPARHPRPSRGRPCRGTGPASRSLAFRFPGSRGLGSTDLGFRRLVLRCFFLVGLATGMAEAGWAQDTPSGALPPPLVAADLPGAPLQPPSPLTVRPRPGSGAPVLSLGPVLETDGVRSSLESGLPIRIRIVTELWRSRTFDALDGRHEWRASLHLDPLSGRYVVETGQGEVTEVPSLAQVRSFLQARLDPPLAPGRSGTFYYLARMEVETLSLSDLDELRRWLRGDLGSAMEGREEVGSALGRGLRRLLVRALRLPVERYEARSEPFTR